jgi:hypothetical protein
VRRISATKKLSRYNESSLSRRCPYHKVLAFKQYQSEQEMTHSPENPNTSSKVEDIIEDRTPTRNPPASPEPSHMIDGLYATLMETSGKYNESWLTFIRKDGNDESLQHMQDQLEKVEQWDIIDNWSTFFLDIENLVSANTAKEMTKLDLNYRWFNRKFDGKLDIINLKFKKRDDDEKKIGKAFDQLGDGRIEDFLSDEDVDPGDLTDTPLSDSDSDTEDASISSSDSEDNDRQRFRDRKNVPKSLIRDGKPPRR